MSSNPDMANRNGYDEDGIRVTAKKGTPNPDMANQPGYDLNGFLVVAEIGTPDPSMANKNGYDDDGYELSTVAGTPNPDFANKPGYDSNGYLVVSKTGTPNPQYANKVGYDANGFQVLGAGYDFYAPNQISLAVQKGTGTYVFDRDDADATVIDNYGLVKQVQADESRFDRARRVHNKADFDLNELTVFAGTDDGWVEAPDGTMTARQYTKASSNLYATLNMLGAPGQERLNSLWMRTPDGTDTIGVQTGYSTNKTDIPIDGTWRRYSAEVSVVTDDSNHVFGFFSFGIGDAGKSVQFWHPQMENVAGRTNKNPSEYVSARVNTGVMPNPNADLSIDVGVNATENYWTASGGASISGGIANVPSLGSLGQVVVGNTSKRGKLYWITYTVANSDLFGTSSFGSTALTGLTAGNTYSYAIRTASDYGWLLASLAGTAIISNMSAYEMIDHGTNVDGVKCFDTENWNYADSVTHRVYDQTAIAPQLRQRIAQNKAISQDPREWLTGPTPVAGTVVAPDGVGVAYTIIPAGSNIVCYDGIAGALNDRFVNTMYIKSTTGFGNQVAKILNGRTNLEATAVNVTEQWQRFSAGDTVDFVGTTRQIGLFELGTAAGKSFDICWTQHELITDPDNYNPSEYVSVGVPTGDEEVNNWPPLAGNLTLGAGWSLGANSLDFSNGVGGTYAEFGIATMSLDANIPYLVSITIENYADAGISGDVVTVWLGEDDSFDIDMTGLTESTLTAVLYQTNLISTNIYITAPTAVGDIISFNVTDLSVKRVDHGYWDNTTDQFLDGYKGFNTTNANTVVSNVVVPAVGDPIAPVDGYLPEPSHANTMAYSEDLTNAIGWPSFSFVKTFVDGSETLAGNKAWEIVSDSTSISSRNFSQIVVKNSSTSDCLQANFATGYRGFALLTLIDASSGVHAATQYFNLATGELGSTDILGTGLVIGAQITPIDGGYRCSMVASTGAGTNGIASFGIADADGDATTDADLDEVLGAVNQPQFLTNVAFASSYIATTTASDVIRNADVFTYPKENVGVGADVNDIVITGTIKTTFDPTLFDANSYILNITGGISYQLILIFTPTGLLRFTKLVSSTPYFSESNAALDAETEYKFAAKISSTTGISLFINGVKQTTGDANTAGLNFSFTPSDLYIGSDYSGANHSSYPIKDIKIYQKDLSDAKCEAITS